MIVKYFRASGIFRHTILIKKVLIIGVVARAVAEQAAAVTDVVDGR